MTVCVAGNSNGGESRISVLCVCSGCYAIATATLNTKPVIEIPSEKKQALELHMDAVEDHAALQNDLLH
ncbi:MAG: hypothetical protein RR505_14175 [Raoultibacter sp.]